MIRYCFLFFLLSSCAFMDRENILVVKNSVTGYPQNIVSKELFTQKKFSFIEASFGRGPSAIMSLSSINNDVHKWISEDNIIIYTYFGFVVKTEGLEHDIETNFKSLSMNKPLIQNVNFLNPPLYGIDFSLIKLGEQPKTLKKGWLKIDSQLVYVKREIPFLNWSNRDKFWINQKTNIVEKTKQHIHPHLPPITITFYYKYR